MVASFELGAVASQVNRITAVIHIAFDSGTEPLWWHVLSLRCRPGLRPALPLVPAPVHCPDWSAGTSFAFIPTYGYVLGQLGPGTATILPVVDMLVGATPVDLDPGVEYHAFTLTLTADNTVGTSACPGCEVPACIALNGLQLEVREGPAVAFLGGPANGTDSHFIRWQGGTRSIPGMPGTCAVATPTRQSTWGAIKSLYR